jgi:glycine/D-amino acid oxidase-like deaminating enzyme
VTRPDIGVVGGGLLGRCLAWRASKAGARVVLCDAAGSQGEGSAAWVAGGMIAATSEAIDAGPQIESMGRRSLLCGPNGWLSCRSLCITGTMAVCYSGAAKMLERQFASRGCSPRATRRDSSNMSKV